jgi:hypothetical protein
MGMLCGGPYSYVACAPVCRAGDVASGDRDSGVGDVVTPQQGGGFRVLRRDRWLSFQFA